MTLQEATALISNQYLSAIPYPTTWTDLGCGNGLFSQALAHIIQPGSIIYAVDKNPVLNSSIHNGTKIIPVVANFELNKLPVSALDGILMANSFHYVLKKEQFVSGLLQQYKNYPIFIIVEYDTLSANRWIPYPIDFIGLTQLFGKRGYTKITQIARHPSIYGNGYMYAALVLK